MANPTLLQLRTSARYRANMENTQFVTDAEFNEYLNYAISDLRDKLIAKVGNDYFATSQTLNLVANQEDYDLSTDFYKLLWVEVKADNALYYKVRRFEVMEKNYGSVPVTNYIPDIRYRLRANKIMFSPLTQIGGREMRVWYVPIPVKLSSDTDTLDAAYNGWDEYVILWAARKALVKEEQDVSQIDAELMKLEQRIEAMADNRDQSEPMRVYDNSINDRFGYWAWR